MKKYFSLFAPIVSLMFLWIFDKAKIFALLLVPFLLGFIVLRALSNSTLLRKRKMLPTSKIRSLAVGEVELVGTLVTEQSYQSPFFKKKCLAFHYSKIKKEFFSDDLEDDADEDDFEENVIYEQKELLPAIVYLEDETGKIPIQLKEPKMLWEKKVITENDIINVEKIIPYNCKVICLGSYNPENGKSHLVVDKIMKSENLYQFELLDNLLKTAEYYLLITCAIITIIILL